MLVKLVAAEQHALLSGGIMRIQVLVLIFGSVLVVTAVAGDVQTVTEVRQARVGQTLVLEFPGNRRAAHRWRLLRDRSKGLEAVDVDALGWILAPDGNSALKSNRDKTPFRVHARAPGQADFTFEHNYLSWGNKYRYQWKTIRVVITSTTSAGKRK